MIAILVSRILGWFEIGRWVGFASFLIIVPLVYLFVVGLSIGRRKIYFVWLALMVLFALFELVVDQILRIDLRRCPAGRGTLCNVLLCRDQRHDWRRISSRQSLGYYGCHYLSYHDSPGFHSTWNNGSLV
jgi:hypothetical protein